MVKKMSKSGRARLEDELTALEIDLNICHLQTRTVLTRYKKIVKDWEGITEGFLSLDCKPAVLMSRVVDMCRERHEKLVCLMLHGLEETSDLLATAFEKYIRARKRLYGEVPSFEESENCV
jgi:hypothetical protein